jgi:site-specific DNA-methyltransferase (adenine-specific)
MGICETSNWLVHNVIVWDKGHFGMGGVFRNQHEFIVVASKGSPPFVNRHNVPNVIQADRPDNSFHPTPKPIGLMAEVIDTLTPPGGLVLDPFAGSSSTGVAAQQVGREYVGIEISEGFAELGRQRLQQAALPLEPEPVASKP